MRRAMDGFSFYIKVGNCRQTITLVRVKAGGSDRTDSTVGGFSDTKWCPSGLYNGGAFNYPSTMYIFMLKDGSGADPISVK